MRFSNLLESVIHSVAVLFCTAYVAFMISLVATVVADPPRNAYFKKCVAAPGDVQQKILCDWVEETVKYYDKKCKHCLTREEGTYPITISWGNQTGAGTLGHALPGKFECRIELAINENWVYDGGMKFRTTVLHEIGHCYGFDHDGDPSSLMYPSHNPGFTEQDVLRFMKRLERIAKPQ